MVAHEHEDIILAAMADEFKDAKPDSEREWARFCTAFWVAVDTARDKTDEEEVARRKKAEETATKPSSSKHIAETAAATGLIKRARAAKKAFSSDRECERESDYAQWARLGTVFCWDAADMALDESGKKAEEASAKPSSSKRFEPAAATGSVKRARSAKKASSSDRECERERDYAQK